MLGIQDPPSILKGLKTLDMMVTPPGFQQCHGKSPFLIGKASISIWAIYTMAMLNNQRVNRIFTYFLTGMAPLVHGVM